MKRILSVIILSLVSLMIFAQNYDKNNSNDDACSLLIERYWYLCDSKQGVSKDTYYYFHKNRTFDYKRVERSGNQDSEQLLPNSLLSFGVTLDINITGKWKEDNGYIIESGQKLVASYDKGEYSKLTQRQKTEFNKKFADFKRQYQLSTRKPINNEMTACDGDWLVLDGVMFCSEAMFQEVERVNKEKEAERMYELGSKCMDAQNYAEAIQYFSNGTEYGNAKCQVALGGCYITGNGVEKDYDKAFELFQKAASQGNTMGELKLGECYYGGYGTGKNFETAAQWFHKAAGHGLHEAEKYEANCYLEIAIQMLNNQGDNLDIPSAMEYIEKAISLDATNPAFYDRKGELLYLSGDKKEAKKIWKQVKTLDSNYYEDHPYSRLNLFMKK